MIAHLNTSESVLEDAIVEFDPGEGFVGHVGGDAFVAVVNPDIAEQVAKRICERFDDV